MTKELFQQYSILVDYLGKVLGPDYEIVLHDLTQSNKEVVRLQTDISAAGQLEVH